MTIPNPAATGTAAPLAAPAPKADVGLVGQRGSERGGRLRTSS